MRCEQWEAIEEQRKAATRAWLGAQKQPEAQKQPQPLYYAVVVEGFPPKSVRGVFRNPYTAAFKAREAGLCGRSRVLGFRTETQAQSADISSLDGAIKIIHI